MESFFTQTATINRPTASVDVSGYPLDTFATLATNVLCRIEETRGAEAVQYLRLTNKKLYNGLFPKAQDIAIRDQIVSGGLTFNVVNVSGYAGVDDLETGVEVSMERTV